MNLLINHEQVKSGAVPLEAIEIHCSYCGWTGNGEELDENEDGDGEWLLKWLKPGEPAPPGSCPGCELPLTMGPIPSQTIEEIEAKKAGQKTTASGRTVSTKIPPPPRKPVDAMTDDSATSTIGWD